jgi:hypothetical protein
MAAAGPALDPAFSTAEEERTEGPEMIRARAKANTVIAAAIVAIGSAFGITVATAPPASAASCTLHLVWNGGDYLDNYGGSSGGYVHTYPHTGSNNQIWCLQAASEGGYYFLQLDSNGNLSGNCLDVPNSNFTHGQRIWVFHCNGTQAQRWCWNGGGYIVTAANAHLALHDWGTYRTVTIESGGNNTWFTIPSIPDNC